MTDQILDELDELDLDELDDFDSDDFDLPTRRASGDYIAQMWNGRGFDTSGNRADAVLIAHGMVTSFLNAFARGERYEVLFDPNMRTAGTNMDTRRTVITPAPILDESLTPQEAGAVLTGLAVHEICHPRYGRDTGKAISAVFKGNGIAHTLSNLLDDVRIEQRFVEDYPGYSGVFDAPMKYVTESIFKRNGNRKMTPRWDRLHEVATAAVRYPSVTDWDGFEEERDWWQDWARRWGREDSPRRHVEAIRDGLKHIVATKIRRELEEAQRREEEERRREEEEQAQSELETQDDADTDEYGLADEDDDGEEADDTADASDGSAVTGTSDDSDDEGEESDEEDDGDGEGPGELEEDDYVPDALRGGGDEDDEPLDAEGLPDDADDGTTGADAGDADDDDESSSLDERADAAADEMGDEDLIDSLDDDSSDLPTCAGSAAVEQAAVENGVDEDDIDEMRQEAQQEIQRAEFYEGDGQGGRVSVARSLKGLIHGHLSNRHSRYFKKSDMASRHIRDALIQSRSGHTNVSHYQKRGRLDQQALHRFTKYDFRLFDRKKAASPGRYNIWMLLDRSGSMDGWPSIQQAQVATAIADASRHVKTVRAAVWAWSWDFRGDSWEAGAALAWRSGQPTSEIAKTIDLRGGGTPDAQIVSWATSAILKESRLGEQPVILLCSDGWGDASLGEKVEAARRKGILVASVAFGALDRESQAERFGRDGFVAWDGDIIRTARPLAKLIARIVGHDRRA